MINARQAYVRIGWHHGNYDIYGLMKADGLEKMRGERMVYVIIALNIVIICLLIDLKMSIPERDYVEEAMIRDAKQRAQKQWLNQNKKKN